ncbi:hypothetical protein NCCP1664_21730 [Zafaria cholistanensis]|uniref:Uncharacterized protein n=1 Tax=Zafaria cholistanensis TaxID=1682741 RepID=A0A5A7NUU0_9MICC|nr:hypothetical protein NCCP1664_21730 [Zafaria cholistanensis]
MKFWVLVTRKFYWGRAPRRRARVRVRRLTFPRLGAFSDSMEPVATGVGWMTTGERHERRPRTARLGPWSMFRLRAENLTQPASYHDSAPRRLHT